MITDSVAVLTLGLLLGVRHAVEPDHVVAMGTIVTRTTSLRKSAVVGALWGLGHTLTLLVVGGALVWWRSALSARTALAMEFAVALMLIVLGFMNLLNARRPEPEPATAARPMVVGMVHGMAGSAAVALLVLATIDDAMLGLLYLLLFGLGTIAGMVMVTSAVVIPTTRMISRAGVSQRVVVVAAGVVSVAFGVAMMLLLGGPDALLAAGP
jgi:high-affinity nickel-transport protein